MNLVSAPRDEGNREDKAADAARRRGMGFITAVVLMVNAMVLVEADRQDGRQAAHTRLIQDERFEVYHRRQYMACTGAAIRTMADETGVTAHYLDRVAYRTCMGRPMPRGSCPEDETRRRETGEGGRPMPRGGG